MILLVGLGNPGPQYAQTRHNTGSLTLDALASRSARGALFRTCFEGQYAELDVGSTRVGALKPETFMNFSGRSVRAAATFFKVAPSELLVVHDDLDVPFGEIRLKSGGGDGGHRGLRSITSELGTPSYSRVRVGIGRPPAHFQGDVADFVLQPFALEERCELGKVLASASQAIVAVITDGLDQTMNRTNQRMVR